MLSPPLRRALPASVTGRVVWRYAIPVAILHLLALLALLPWLWSWTGPVLLVVGTYVYGGVGINLAYHRLLTHRSFRCPLWLERCFVVVAVCCLEDAPGSWVATHRMHHNDSDEQPDPHGRRAGDEELARGPPAQREEHEPPLVGRRAGRAAELADGDEHVGYYAA